MRARMLIGAAVAVLVLVSAIVMASAQADYNRDSGDYIAYTNPDGSTDYYICAGEDCTRDGAEWCGSCHADKRDTKRYDSRRHRTTHFPQMEYRVTAGDQLRWRKDTRLVTRNGSLQLVSSNGRPILRLPAGTRVLKNRAGRPFLVHATSAPVRISR